MPCSYCNTPGHNISHCVSAALERAVEIYNDGIDTHTLSRKRKNIFYPSIGNTSTWLTDSNGRIPSHPDWNTNGQPNNILDVYAIYRGKFIGNRIPPAESAVISNIYKFRNLSRDIINDGHPNMDYYVVRLNDATRFVKISREISDNRNTIVYTTYSNYHEGHDVYTAFIAQSRGLEQLRMQHRGERWRENMLLQRQQQLQLQRQEAEQTRRQQQQQHLMQQQRLIDNLVLREKPVQANECAICLEPFGNTNKIILRCGHQFCGDCIFQHFQGKGGTKCPQCRNEFAIRIHGWKPPHTIPHNIFNLNF